MSTKTPRLPAAIRNRMIDSAFFAMKVKSNNKLDDAVLHALLAPWRNNPVPLLLKMGLISTSNTVH